MKWPWKVTWIVLIALICIEISLHFYSPIYTKGNNPYAGGKPNARYEFKDFNAEGLAKDFIHTKNSMGFRGNELKEGDKIKRIICMGGSSTECFFLSDGHDWPALLGSRFHASDSNLWFNNVGITGSSATDALILLKKRILKLKPDCIFLSCGLDDIGNTPSKSDLTAENALMRFYHFLEIPKLFSSQNKQDNINKFELLDLKKAEMFEMSDTQILQRIAMEQPILSHFRKSLQEFADICKANKIQLILVSPVILFGDERDLVSDVNLGNVKTGDINGRTEALLLKQYNKASYEVAELNHLPFINLSARLPKDSRFFYDGFHFSNDGAEMVANIIFDEARDLIKK